MRIKTTILLVITICLGACSGVSQEEYTAAQELITVLENQIIELEGALETANTTIDGLDTDLAEANNSLMQLSAEVDRLTIFETQLAEKETELTSLQGDFDVLSGDYESMQEKYEEATNTSLSLGTELKKHNCSAKFTTMQYESIMDVSTILSGWMATQSWTERIQGTYRDTIWNNADTKIHAVRYISADDNQPYVEHFLVYFDEFGFDLGVFWVRGQCWLERK